jgi:hypothetical protein
VLENVLIWQDFFQFLIVTIFKSKFI